MFWMRQVPTKKSKSDAPAARCELVIEPPVVGDAHYLMDFPS
jgi:hypothetical protein